MNISQEYMKKADLPRLLLVDDDKTYCSVLQPALIKRGFEVAVAYTVMEGRQLAKQIEPEYAVVDLRIGQDSGLVLAEYLSKLDQHTRIVILTAYASIATAVEAIKLGAVHYLTKPADADEIVAVLHQDGGDPGVPLAARTISVKRLEWEHIQKVLLECGGNISAAARTLGMHRRTLQRKLKKHPVRR